MNIKLPAVRPHAIFACVLASAGLFAAHAAHAKGNDQLVRLINAYRAAPPSCGGSQVRPRAPLAAHPALARVKVAAGTFLDQAIEQAGYQAAKAEAIYVAGPPDAPAVMASIEAKYCNSLLNPDFSDIGAIRSGDTWLIVLATAAPPPAINLLPDPETAGKAVLEAVNAARATPRNCGARYFPAARSVSWNAFLGHAALTHSRDMAATRDFSHKGKDGSNAAERARQAGYRWLRVGENIASGQTSPEEVVAGWLTSPGHCENIMNNAFTEMGAGYAVDRSRKVPRAYWTQVFAAPR
ncbi:CAP domain-containing protein [Massilia sp. GCM10020059]|uniref:CAP domain-containing protein n=1 Tax=Massilia agrisoli TaxID=2892444 RepID=A0ABS8INW3_9BURK|nr:CAP domain-containing protein [Massilia agrisoli]MCC6069566.1 CAP domain-containing protein [Massilia agrisoli]